MIFLNCSLFLLKVGFQKSGRPRGRARFHPDPFPIFQEHDSHHRFLISAWKIDKSVSDQNILVFINDS